jgi:single-strand DNA-binding protein
MSASRLVMPRRNKVFLVGRLVADPILKSTPNGRSVCTFRMANNEPIGPTASPDGTKRERSLFINVTTWGRQAETCAKYLKKLSVVDVEGRLEQQEWVSKKSQTKRSEIFITANTVQFLSRPNSSTPAPVL